MTRGGGSLEDLWSFNEEATVRAVAGSDIPTVSAVGHEIDVTLTDLASDLRALTPSEAAERVVPSAHDVQGAMANLQTRMHQSLATRVSNLRQRLDSLASRPALARPLDRIHHLERQLDELVTKLHQSATVKLRDHQSRLASASGKLSALSPLAVLSRGYSLTHDEKSGQLVTSAGQVRKGQQIVTRLEKDSILSTVDSTTTNKR